MAQPDLESFERRGVAVKEEVTEGTDSVPAAGTDAILMLNGQSGTEFDSVERPVDRPFFGADPFAVTNKRAFIEGDVEIQPPTIPGDATDGTPHYDILLRMGGMAKTLDSTAGTTTYNPISTGIVSASAYFWHVDYVKKVLGARNAISGMRFPIGEIPTFRSRILGSYTDVTADTLPTLTLPTYTPESVQADNGTCLITVTDASITDLNLWAKELSVDFGSELTNKQYTTKEVNSISDRVPSFTLRIARTDLSDFNPWSVRDNGYIINASLEHEIAGGLYAKLSVRGQIEGINEVDIDGDLGWELNGRCIPSDSGGDELELEFGDNSP